MTLYVVGLWIPSSMFLVGMIVGLVYGNIANALLNGLVALLFVPSWRRV